MSAPYTPKNRDLPTAGLDHAARPLAVVTGASTGIGLELAKQCGQHGYDLLLVADEPEIKNAAQLVARDGISVEAIEADLATTEGVDELLAAVSNRPIDALLANAGRGLGHAFVEQDWDEIRHVIDTNVTGTVYLIHQVAKQMKANGNGRILITGSIAGFIPGTFTAVYNGTKAFIDSFAWALRAELKGSGVTVTCLMPGATETAFFARADMLDTKVGQGKKDDPADVAEIGYKAMVADDGDVVTGWQNKLQVAIASITPSALLAEQHRKKAEPGSAKH